MMNNYKSWLFAALFVLFGLFGAQAQDYIVLNLSVQHAESDYVPADETNYYRHFLTLENVIEGESGVNTLSIAAGDDHFILYRYAANIEDAIRIPVADLSLSVSEAGVDYEITYLNQEPLAGYDLDLVTEGTLAVEDFFVNFDGLVLVDQFAIHLPAEGYGPESIDETYFGYRRGCKYVMEREDETTSSNTVDIAFPALACYSMALYNKNQVMEDFDAALPAGIKNAYVEYYNLPEDPEVTGCVLMRGDNTYPNEIISNLEHGDGNYTEVSEALPDYFGQTEYYVVERMDTADVITGTFGDYMTYVPVVMTDGSKRVKQDGPNTYGNPLNKTGLASLEAIVDGVITDLSTDDPWMWEDENGELCAYFLPVFDIKAVMPDYATWEYVPYLIRIWVKCDNIRDCYVDDDGNIVNIDDFSDTNFTFLGQEYFEDMWDDGEYPEQFTLGGPETGYSYAFGATYNPPLLRGIS